MYCLPTLKLEDVPLRLDGLGRIVICKQAEAVLLGEFLLSIKAEKAEDHNEWRIDGIALRLGEGGVEQTYTALDFVHLRQELGEHQEAAICEHVANHLGDEVDQAAFDAMPSWRRSA